MSKIRTLGVAAGIALMALSSPAFAGGDAAKGEKVFKKCKACHSEEAGKNKVGPSLFGVVGRHAGTVEGYKYSKINGEASHAGLVWDEDTIAAYLEDPQKYLESYLEAKGMKGDGKTKMNFKLKKEDERADVAAYLATLK